MTVAQLLKALAEEVCNGRADWEVDLSILHKKDLPGLRWFGQSSGLHMDRTNKTIVVESRIREPRKGEL